MATITFDPFNVAGLIATTLSLGLAIYFYFRSIRKPIPTCFVHPLRVKIVDKTQVNVWGLEVFHRDQSLAAQNVTAATVYFWNEGREPMRPSQVLTPYTIQLAGDDVRVLDWKIKSLRPEGSFSMEGTCLRFEVIEKSHDAAQIQIIYAGDPNAAISIHGVIVGAPKVRVQTSEQSLVTRVVGLILILTLVLLAFVASYTFDYVTRTTVSRTGRGAALVGILAVVVACTVWVIVLTNRLTSRSVVAQFAKL